MMGMADEDELTIDKLGLKHKVLPHLPYGELLRRYSIIMPVPPKLTHVCS